MSAPTYEHAINATIGGAGKRPIVELWCMDCLLTVGNFDQINAWADLQQAVTKHCSEPSRREILRSKRAEKENEDD